MTIKNVNEEPTLAQVLKDAIEARLVNLHVSMPARVVSYNASKQTAEVQPEIKRIFRTNESAEIPVIVNVPVAWPRANKAYIHMPLKAGDQVMLVFSERSLDEWKQNGGSVRPKELRKHDLTDAWAVPGGYPFSNTVNANDKDLTIVHDKSIFTLKANGKFSLKGNGDEELLKILSELMQILGTTTTNTIFGPMRLNNHPQILELKQRLDKLKV